MSRVRHYWGRWLRSIGPAVVAYSVVGLLVDASVPRFLPENALTMAVGEAAKVGVFAIWFYLIWRIFGTIKAIYGPDSAGYLERTPIWRILLDVTAAYVLAAFCFSVIYVYLVRHNANAFSAELKLGDALYFSIVSMTTTVMATYRPGLDRQGSSFVCKSCSASSTTSSSSRFSPGLQADDVQIEPRHLLSDARHRQRVCSIEHYTLNNHAERNGKQTK